MLRKLNPTEKQELKSLHRKERDKRKCDRIKAVLAFDDGYSYVEIARILLLDDETIRRHIDDYFTKHKKIAPENGGSESYLTAIETETLISHLHQCTYLYVKDICAYVRQEFDKVYSISGMTKWLHQHHFRYKKPHAVPAKADKAKQQAFLEYYKQLKIKASTKEPIYFVDSTHPQHQSHLVYGWIFKGVRKGIATTGQQKRLNVIGGISLSNHQFCYKLAEKINAETIALFLGVLRKKHPDKRLIHLIWDNAGYHKDKNLIKFAGEIGIQLHYLPPYSPNLNPIERLWKLMHELTTYNKYYEKFADFKESILSFLKTIGRKKKILRTRITDKFNLLHSPILAS